MRGISVIFFVVLLAAGKVSAQYKPSFVAYPLGYYSPETRFAVGIGGAVNFRMNKSDSIAPVSQIGLGGGITQNRQATVAIPFALYFSERKHSVTGEFSYNDFSYNFYGVGGGNYNGEKSVYELQYTVMRANYLFQFHPRFFAGARWWYQKDVIQSFTDNPEISNEFAGRAGGTSSGPGVMMMFDSRDNIYYAQKGLMVELVYHNQQSIWGSDFRFNRYRFDVRHFLPVTSSWTLASNFFGDFTSGDVPFGQMAALSSGNRGRGYYQGRYRDKNILLYQAELRGMLDERWGVTAFCNYGILSSKMSDFNFQNDHTAVGFGVRYAFDKRNRSNVRLDIAWPLLNGVYIYDPNEATKVYLTINEAF